METKRMGLLGTVLGLMILLALVLCMPSKMMAENGMAPGGDESGVFDDSGDAEEKAADDGKSSDNASTEDASTEEEAAEDTSGITNEIRMSTDGTFEFHVQDADLRSVLKHLSSLGRINIIVTKDVQGSVTLDMYGVTLMEALRIIVRSNGLVYRKEGKFIFIYTAKEYQESRKMDFRVFRLSFITAADAQKLIAGALSDKGKVTVTPPTKTGVLEPPSDIDDQGGAMNHASSEVVIVFDYEENLEKVAEILHDVDVRPQQVLIEATILSAELDEETSLGVNIQALSGASMGSLSATTDLTSIDFSKTAVSNYSNNTQGRFNLPFNAKVADGVTPMSVGFIYNNTAVFIEALETVTNTTVLANPKMLVVNKQRGEILVGNEDGYITTEISEGLVTQTVEFLKTGTNLTVRPFISKDGFVRIELHPEISSGAVSIVDGAADTSTPLPNKKTTTMTSNILVKDGHTIVIGGLFQDRIKTERSQVPVLGDIPHIGAAFRSTYDTTVREEIIILITPHIIRHTEDEAFSATLKDDIERSRVGARKQLQWWSRSRLADLYINEAEKAYSRGNTKWANWNLDLALAIEPQEDQAIKLKEKITGTPYWADVPRFSRVRDVVDRMVMNELDLPNTSVVYPTKELDTNKIPAAARERLDLRPLPKARKVAKKQPVEKPKPQDRWNREKDESGIEIFTPQEVKKEASKPKTTPAKLVPAKKSEKSEPAKKTLKAEAKKPVEEVKEPVKKPQPEKPKKEATITKGLLPESAAEKPKEEKPKTDKVEKIVKVAPAEPLDPEPITPPTENKPSKESAAEEKKQFEEKVNEQIQDVESSVEEKLEEEKQELEEQPNSMTPKPGIENEAQAQKGADSEELQVIRLIDPKLRKTGKQDAMPEPEKVLHTSPLLPDNEPISLDDDIRKKAASQPSTKAADSKTEAKADKTQPVKKAKEKSKDAKWTVWTVWDEDEPVSVR